METERPITITPEKEHGRPNQPPAPLPPRMERQFTLVHLMILVAVCALVFSVLVLPGGQAVFAFLITLGIPVVIVAIIVVWLSRRSTQQDALLWVMSLAMQRRMPLAPGVLAVADLFGPAFRNRMWHFAGLLSAGTSLPESLARVPGLLPRPALVLVRLGWETATMPAALREAAAMRTAHGRVRRPFLSKLAYLVAMLNVIQGICGFMLYFILPKFEAIMADFGIALPAVTVLLISASHFLMRTGLLPLLSLLGTLLVFWVVLHLLGWLPLPLVGRFRKRRQMAVVLRGLAVVVEAEKPMTEGIAALARSYPERWLRKRLKRVLWAMEQGASWFECLHWQDLIRPAEAALLASAERAGNLPWALREVAESSERRLDFRLQIWSQIFFVLVVITLGAMVFFIVLAYFAPLIALIQRMTP